MSHIALYISEFLNQNKTVSLEKIGKISLKSGAVSLSESEGSLPQVDFEFDKQATTTPELVDYIQQQIKKSRSIVSSDVDYYLDESRQLINIGTRPLIIPGVGYIKSDRANGFSFSQETINGFADHEQRPKAYKDDLYSQYVEKEEVAHEDAGIGDVGKRYERERTFGVSSRSTSNANMPKMIGIVVGILLGIGIIYAGFHFMSGSDKEVTEPTDSTATLNSSTPAKADTTVTTKDTVAVAAKPAVANGFVANTDPNAPYKYIFETTTNAARAQSRINQLIGFGDKDAHYDSALVNNVMTYRLYLEKKIPASDTLKVKKEVWKYFQRYITITK